MAVAVETVVAAVVIAVAVVVIAVATEGPVNLVVKTVAPIGLAKNETTNQVKLTKPGIIFRVWAFSPGG